MNKQWRIRRDAAGGKAIVSLFALRTRAYDGGCQAFGGDMENRAGKYEGRRSGMYRFRASAMFAFLLAAAGGWAKPARAQTLDVLYNFTLQSGAEPLAGLVRDKTGNLYGTTDSGGVNTCFNDYCGVVFELDASGNEHILYEFTGGKDGGMSGAPLIRDPSGNLYGTAYVGGNFDKCGEGCGVVFQINEAGKEKVLHTFRGGTKDGCGPLAGLVKDSAGNLYGTTFHCGTWGYGTVFKLDHKGNETLLHSFSGRDNGDGENPYGLLLDRKGNLYGVAVMGGTSDNGVVYKLDKNGHETVLHSFGGGNSDGCQPIGTPTMDAAGNLYGTTFDCGSYSGDGIVWKLSASHKETVLHRFSGGSTDGAEPRSGVILSKGILYGETWLGGPSNFGTIFELKQNQHNKMILLHTFTGADGVGPWGDMIQDAQGNFYGTTSIGGYAWGTAWKLTPQGVESKLTAF